MTTKRPTVDISFTWTLWRIGDFVAAKALVPICLLRKSRETWVSLFWFLDLPYWLMILNFIWCCIADICPLPVERSWGEGASWKILVTLSSGNWGWGGRRRRVLIESYQGIPTQVGRYWGDRLDWKISEFSKLQEIAVFAEWLGKRLIWKSSSIQLP